MNLPDENLEEQEYLAQLRNTIELGTEAEDFLKGELGRYMVSQARENIDAAFDKLKTLDPEDTEAIRKAQNIIKVEELIFSRLQAAIEAKDMVWQEEAAEDDLQP